jgi:replicative DNA helicase
MSRNGNNTHKERISGTLRQGLPCNVDAERYVLGCILLSAEEQYAKVALLLERNDFSLEKHRRIFAAMERLSEQQIPIDRVTVAEELMKFNQLQSCDGLTYIVSLDDGLPLGGPNIEAYCQMVKEKATLRSSIFLAERTSVQARMSDANADQVVSEATGNFLELATGVKQGARRGTHSLSEIIADFPGGLKSLSGVGMKSLGLSTGYVRYDDLTGGLQPGELIIFGGRPSMGKTALGLSMAQNIAMRHLRNPELGPAHVAIHSLEMSRESLLTRLVCQIARVNSYAYRSGLLSKEERAKVMMAVGTLDELPIHINDDAGQRVPDIHLSARNLMGRVPLKLLIIDYLGLITPVKPTDNRNHDIGIMSRGLKALAKELNIPVVVLVQLSRACESRRDPRPILADIRECGDVEQDADLVAFVFRESVYKPDREDLKGYAELLIRKQRNGPIGDVPLVYLAGSTRFENRAADAD